MNHIEEEYNKRFNKQQLPDDGFDVEDLWNDISEDLDGKDDTKILPSNRLILLLIGVSLITALFLSLGKSEHSKNTEHQFTNSNKNVEILNERPFVSLSEQKTEQKNLTKAPPEKKAPESKTGFNTSEEIYLSKNSIQNSIQNGSENTSSNTNISNHESGNEIPSNNKSKTSKETPTVQESSIQKQTIVPTITTSTKGSIYKLALLPTKLSFIESNYPVHPNFEFLKTSSKSRKIKRDIRWKAGLWGGINSTKFKYQSDNFSALASLKEQSEKQQMGISFGANTTLILKNNWLLSSGIEFHQLESRFEFIQQQNIDVVKENHLLRVWLDASTNDTLNTQYGNTTVNALTTREVVHYNQFKQISVPIQVGYQHTSNKLIFGANAGVLFNFLVTQSGKHLNGDSEISIFEKNTSNAPFNTFNLGYRISPFIGYQITDNWSMLIRPQFTVQTHSKFDGTDIRMRTQQYHLNLGLEYTFK